MSLYVAFISGRAAFFDDRLTAPPEGAVEISAEQHAALLDGQATGQTISPGATGVPELVAALPPTEADRLAAERAGMSCSQMQGILALGEARWSVVTAYRDDPATTFAERAIIDHSGVWYRQSQNIQFFAYILGLGDEEVDELFRQAAQIVA